MSEWATVPIRELFAETFAGDWGGNPMPSTAHVLRATDIDDEGNISGRGAPRRIAPSTIARKQLEDGDILLEASGGSTDKPVGRVAHFDGKNFQDRTYLCSNFFKTLRSKHEHDAKFVFWKLYWFYRQNQILAFQQQTTGIINLKFEEYLSAPVSIPGNPLEEGKIAQILDTLDTQIRQTEALIAKLESIKQGLLADLLTRGIDENGQLRPSPEQASHLYKDSPLGWVPKDWNHIHLGNLGHVTVGFVGTTSPFYTTAHRGVLFLRTGNITKKGIDLSDVRWIGHAFHNANPKSALERGDVVVSRVGYTGNAAVIPAIEPANCANMIIIRCGEKLVPNYLRLLFSADIFIKQVAGFTIGSAQPVLNINLVKRLLTPLPQPKEQLAIVESVVSLERRIHEEEIVKHTLESLKFGLMDDLLTGRVRVTPLLDTAEQVIG